MNNVKRECGICTAEFQPLEFGFVIESPKRQYVICKECFKEALDIS